MRTIAKILVLVLVIALFAPIIAQAQNEQIRIIHTPVSFAKVNSSLQIEAYLESASGSIGNITAAKLWFKNSNQDVFDFVDMIPFLDKYVGTVPPDFVTFDGIDYFIEFILADGSAQTYPTTQPLTEPFSISVRPVDADAAKNAVILLSPTPFGKSYGETLIAIGFNRSVLQVEPSKVKIHLNGNNFTKKANISEEVAVLVVDNLSTERQRIDLIYEGDDGPEILGSWTFFWRTEGSKGFALGEYASASFSSEARSQKNNGFENNTFTERFNAKFDYGLIHLSTFGTLKSTEQASLQPQHRFQAKFALGKALTFRWGDINPKYNELILYGQRVRGSEFILDAKYLKLEAIYGDMTRSKNPFETIIPATDSTEVSYSYSGGMYKRYLGAAKLSFGNPRKALFGLSVMKVKDDTSSVLHGSVEGVNIGSTPKDNLVAGLDVKFYFDRRRITLQALTALSLYNSNTLSAPLEDADEFKEFIWINQHFDPLPSEGLNSDSADVGQIVKSIINNALSYKARLRMRYLGNDLKATLKKINRSYHTLGYQNLTNDKQGYTIDDRIRMFKSHLYLNLKYDYSYDNVTGKGDIRNDNSILSAGFSLYTPEYMPDVTFSYANTLNANDGEQTFFLTDSLNTADSIDSLDTRKEKETDRWTLALSHKANLGTTINSIGLNVYNTDKNNIYFALGSYDIQGFSIKVKTQFEHPLITEIVFGSSELHSMNGETNTTNNSLNLKGIYFLLNRKLVPYIGTRFSSQSGPSVFDTFEPLTDDDKKSKTRLKHMDETSVTFYAGMTWKIIKNHSLDAGISLKNHSQNGEWEYWNGERFSVNDKVIINDGVTVNQDVVDRNDMMMTITYQVRF
jgi:hypothetical protein